MQILNGLIQYFHNDKPPTSETSQRIGSVPRGITFSDLCAYTNTLYEVFDLSFQKFEETTDEVFALTAIDTLLVIQHFERMKEHVTPPVYKRN